MSSDDALHEQTFDSDSPAQSSTENESPTLESFSQTEESNQKFLCNGKFSDFLSGGIVSGTRNSAVGSSAFDGLLNLNTSPSLSSPKGQKIHIFDGENACNDLTSSLACNHLKESIYGNCSAGSVAGSPTLADAIMALHKFLPSNNEDESWPFIDVYSSDEFRMYDFKVRKCMRGRSHDWTECPFVHPGEKARRRDPRRFHYSGTACSDFRKGCCKKGDACEYAHGVFECWLHPSRYRTQPCKDGKNCRRRVCFFAHTSEQLRVLPGSSQSGDSSSSRAALYCSSPKTSLGGCYDGSPLRQALTGSLDRGMFGTLDSPLSKICYGGPCYSAQISSPTSTLVGHSQSPPSFSPPVSPPGSPPCWNAVTMPYIGPLPNCVSSQQQPPVIIANGNSGAVKSSFSASGGAGHRRHLERLNPMLSVSIPAIEAGDSGHIISPGSISCYKGAHVMSNLLASMQQLELGTRTCQSTSICSPRMSSLCPISMSPSSVPRKDRLADQKDLWGVNECEMGPQLERVESGRDLRAKIYGRLSKENPLESDSPDLDWVNELVK